MNVENPSQGPAEEYSRMGSEKAEAWKSHLESLMGNAPDSVKDELKKAHTSAAEDSDRLVATAQEDAGKENEQFDKEKQKQVPAAPESIEPPKKEKSEKSEESIILEREILKEINDTLENAENVPKNEEEMRELIKKAQIDLTKAFLESLENAELPVYQRNRTPDILRLTNRIAQTYHTEMSVIKDLEDEGIDPSGMSRKERRDVAGEIRESKREQSDIKYLEDEGIDPSGMSRKERRDVAGEIRESKRDPFR